MYQAGAHIYKTGDHMSQAGDHVYQGVAKCKFHITSYDYLGYMLSPEGLTKALYKVQIIQDWPTSIVVSFMDIPKSPFCLCVLPTRLPHGTFPMSAVPLLKHLKSLSPQLQSLPIGSQTLTVMSHNTHVTSADKLW